MKKIERKIDDISLNEKEKTLVDVVLVCMLFAGTVLTTSFIIMTIIKIISLWK